MNKAWKQRFLNPLSLSLIVAALLIAGAAIDRLMQSALFTDTEAANTASAETEVRITATPRSDGSIKLGLQQQEPDGAWADVQYPEFNILPADAEPNRRLHSSPLTVSSETDVYTLADAYYDHARHIAQPTVLTPHDPKIWCLVHDAEDNDAGRAYCQGFTDGLGEEAVETFPYTDLRTGVGQVVGRIAGGDVPHLLAAGKVEELFGLLGAFARFPGGSPVPVAFPLDTIDPEPPAGANYCVIGHGENSFWGLAFDAAVAGANHYGVNLDHVGLTSAEERAARIRECIADDVDAIAVTLAETEHVADALREARAAGIPVVTYNSGADTAREVGSMIHLGLNDRKAGEIVGTRLTADGVEGPALCLLHEPVNVGLEDRCQGLDDTFGEVEKISLADGLGPLSERLAAGDVGAVVLLNAADVAAVANLIQASGHAPTLAVIGFDTQLVLQMLSGRVAFAVWDHATLQGYLAVALAALADTTFLVPDIIFNGAQLLIEPTILTPNDMRTLLARAGG
ncbi:MAG: substrate-binding domain-containing protein [Chloroflexota bacterium]|nr:substrate-binding domain-containing protein [Chloroflexota bacterium]MDE2896278.1 substrate-binding domain-containing protein [Chloroflexota bacterium]